jgi:hypothetical protein
VKYLCPECGSDDVQCQMWVNPNTRKILEDTDRYRWCIACEERTGDGELKYLELVEDECQ